MITEDLQFEIINEDGKNIECIIVASVPIDEHQVNIMYKREDDNDDTFRYGKIVKENNLYKIKKDINEEELLVLREMFDNEMMNAMNVISTQLEEE